MGNTTRAMKVVSIKLPEDLDRRLTDIARHRGATRSAVLREALSDLARRERRSVTAAAGKLVGSLAGPRGLSTARRHMTGYGK